jgi:hypothetical protein
VTSPKLKNEIKISGGVEDIASQKVPGIYCSIGTAACRDLKFSRQCICNTCPVWEEYNLSNRKINDYYCNQGSNKQKRLIFKNLHD